MTTIRPVRRYEIQINISSNYLGEVIHSMRSILAKLEAYEDQQPIVFNKIASDISYSVTEKINDSVTPESYQSAIEEYTSQLAERQPAPVKVCKCESGFQGQEWTCSECEGALF